jgi:hypothetical protein
MTDLQARTAELIEASISNLIDGLGCNQTEALKLLLIQSALRLPTETVHEALRYTLNGSDPST